MTTYSTRPALDFPLVELADLFTRSFAEYFMPVNMTTHPGKTWHIPAIFPEETIGPFENLVSSVKKSHSGK